MKRPASDAIPPHPRRYKDTSCRKRVTFTDLSDDSLSCRRHAKPIASKTHTTISGDPKTSEYAFFKQLKEHAGHSSDLHTKNKEGNQSDKLRSSYFSREKDSIKNSYPHLRDSLHAENCPPVNSDSFFSPIVSASNNSEVCLKTASATMTENRGGMQENMNGLVTTLKPARFENKHGDTFSRKRQKLLEWVTGTSFPDIDELCSNGHDFVSVLLSRLTPKNNEDNSSEPPKSMQPDADVTLKLDAPSESDIHFKKLYQITGNLMEVDQGQYFKDGLTSYWSDRSREKVLSDYRSPIFHAYKTYHQDIMRNEPEYRLGRRAAVSCMESDSDFSFEKNSYFPLFHVEEQHEFHNQNRYLLGREPQALLLGWDSDMTKEANFSNNSQNQELITYPKSLSLWDDHEQCPNDRDAASWLSTPSSSTNCPSLCSCLPTQSASYQTHDFGGHIFEENENMVTELNNFPLTLSNRPDHLSLNEHCNYSNICKEAFLFSSGCDVNSAWKCLSIAEATSRGCFSSTSDDLQFPQKEGISSLFLNDDNWDNDSDHREDGNLYSNILNIQDLPTFYFQAYRNREVACPLLLDNILIGMDSEGTEDGELEYF